MAAVGDAGAEGARRGRLALPLPGPGLSSSGLLGPEPFTGIMLQNLKKKKKRILLLMSAV